MNKTAIKNYSIWARVNLIDAVKQKAFEYEITENCELNTGLTAVAGRLLSKTEKEQRNRLISEIRAKGFEQVMEEVAYTWFNRFIALRYMEVNGFLPSRVRVFSDENGEFKPEILKEAMTVEIDGLDREKVLDFMDRQDNENLFKYLIITQCNALGVGLPGMFEKIENYTELLFPNNLLKADSVIGKLVTEIPEEDWTDAIQIIGWMYQYYNTELKDDTFAKLKKNIKITKERIPAATQLFTPDWIVRYMVENSLGRIVVSSQLLAVSSKPLATSYHERELVRIEKEKEIAESYGWKYYLPEAEQEESVRTELMANSYRLTAEKLTELRIIDPCMGSGHILVYAFDVLMQIYTSAGWSERDAAKSIVENNIFGLDIDDRAAQLSYFAVMMKARQYDRRIFSRGIQPHIYAIAESNGITRDVIEYFENGRADLKKALKSIIAELHDAKEYGSILNVTPVDFAALYARFDEISEGNDIFRNDTLTELKPLVQVAELMSRKYDAVITNPPYMGASGMSAKLSNYVKKNFPDSKSDLFAVFIEHCGTMLKKNAFQSMITQHAWMFLSSYENLRHKLLTVDTVNMAHLGPRAFEEIGGEVVQTTSFVLRKTHTKQYKGTYCRLVEPTTQQGKEDLYLTGKNRYTTSEENFSKIPGSPIAYWVSDDFANAFKNSTLEDQVYAVSKGIITTNNDLYLRLWHEVLRDDVKNRRWNKYSKGGHFNKWYGNSEHVIIWENDGSILRNSGVALMGPSQYYNLEHFVWSGITTYKPSFRIEDRTVFFDDVAPAVLFKNTENMLYLCALCNSVVVEYILQIINPTMHILAKDVKSIPVIYNKKVQNIVNELTIESIDISRKDWDSFETSWDFKWHPLV